MKKFTLLFVFLFTLVGITNAQQEDQDNYKLSSLTISSGEGALSSGIFASATIQGTNDTKLIFEVCSSFVQAMYGKQIGDFFVAGSGGAFNNTAWIGPYVVYTPYNWVSFTTWEGASAGKDKHPDIKHIQFYFAYNNARANFSIFYLQWSVIHFQKDIPNHLPGGGLSVPLGKYMVFAGCDYSLRDHKPLYSAGITAAL